MVLRHIDAYAGWEWLPGDLSPSEARGLPTPHFGGLLGPVDCPTGNRLDVASTCGEMCIALPRKVATSSGLSPEVLQSLMCMAHWNTLRLAGWDRACQPPVRRVKLLLAITAVWTPGVSPLSATSDAATPLTAGFLSAPTDQIAVPGMIAGGEITPEGDLYTGWAEYELRFGLRLKAWDQPTRTLPNPAMPLLSSTMSDGAMHYTQTVFAIGVGGQPVAYDTVTATNASDHPSWAQVAMALAYTRGPQLVGAHGMRTGAYRYERPLTGQPPGFYDQPGQRFSSSFSYSLAGRDVIRSGVMLARGPAAPSHPVGTPAGSQLTAPHDGRLFRARVNAYGRVSFTWQIPLNPGAPTASLNNTLDRVPMSRARAALLHTWESEESGMMQISLPEAKATAAYQAAIGEILSSRYRTPSGWIQGSNKLQYQAFWLRDGAIDTQALDLAGLHRQAEQNLAFLDTYQRPDGLFISRAGQYDGFGQSLWALDQHTRLSQDPGYASAQLARIGVAIKWLSAATSADPLGLLPPGNPRDNELAYGHITGDNLWAAAGLRSAVSEASLSGRGDLASAWQAVDAGFEASLDHGLSVAVARTGHIPPVLDAAGGQDWGNYYAAYPVQVLAARSPTVSATVAWARAHMVQGLPTYLNGHSLHDYLGFSVFQTELAAGNASDALAGLYSELAHTTSSDNGWEWDIAPFGQRASAINLAPHGTFAGDYVALLRNMLVADTASGGVDLLAGASPAWLAPGQHITVTVAPTDHGIISFTERSSARGESLTWKSTLAPGTPLTWTLPVWARHATTSSGRVAGATIVLRGDSGSVEVSFSGRRPAQSYALAVAALNAAYRRHGQPAPLVPVAD
jgi:hypothetical protein